MMGSATRHLMLDALWRGRMGWLWAGICVGLAWTLVSLGYVSAKAGVATSLVAVFVVGPMTSLTAVAVRETRFLPLTSRDVWVAAWLLSTVGAAIFVLVLQSIGMAIGIVFGFPPTAAPMSLPFVAICSFAYGGALLPIGPLLGYTASAAAERRPRWFWVSIAIVTFLAYFAGLIVPWAAWSFLPASFAQLSWWSGTALVLGLIAAFAALAWTPQRGGGMTTTGTHAITTKASGTRAGRARARRADRLTGLSRLLLPHLAMTFLFLLLGAVGAAVYAYTFEPSQSLYESFAGYGLLPFSAAGLSSEVILGTALFVVFFALSGGWAWDGYTRHLRVLPLSAAEITQILMSTTALQWVLAWVVLLTIHLFVLGMRPTTLRPELFLYMTGLSALLESASRIRTKPGKQYFAVIPVLVMVGAFEGFSARGGVSAMFWAHAIAGAAGFLAAAFLTYRSLRRSTSSSAAYQSTVRSFNA